MKIFVDSNIFLYTLDLGEITRREKAKEALLGLEDRIVISTQVVNEVYSVATRKLGIDPVMIKKFVRQLFCFEVVNINQEVIESAIDCSILNKISYWDALMIAASESVNCYRLWTEDLSPGTEICGVRIENPLTAP